MSARTSLAARLAAGCTSFLLSGFPALAADVPARVSSGRDDKTALWISVLRDAALMSPASHGGPSGGGDEDDTAPGADVLSIDGWKPGIWSGVVRRNSSAMDEIRRLTSARDMRVDDPAPSPEENEPVADRRPEEDAGQAAGNTIFLINGALEELALWGFDGESGYRMPMEAYNLDGRAPDEPTGAIPPGARYHDLRPSRGGFRPADVLIVTTSAELAAAARHASAHTPLATLVDAADFADTGLDIDETLLDGGEEQPCCAERQTGLTGPYGPADVEFTSARR